MTDTEPTTRGKVTAILAWPAKLLTAQGLFTGCGGFFTLVVWMVPLVIDGASLDRETLIILGVGLVLFAWGALIIYGAIQMKRLSSYGWASVGSVLGLVPFLVGGYVLLALRNPDVKAAFEEVAAGGFAQRWHSAQR